ncbi:MAG: HPr family phosphocarrier protein [Geminicoccaceae bacterium]|nr:HPr family phosphocarrier protein [Geminicoccaceae bacterium]
MRGPEGLRREVVIVNRLGLHARAAARFVKLAERFDARIRVIKDDLEVAGTSILGLMTLAASPGVTLELRAVGAEAGPAIEALVALVARGFDEE